MADQLRTIGDEFNATVLRRAVSGGTGLQFKVCPLVRLNLISLKCLGVELERS